MFLRPALSLPWQENKHFMLCFLITFSTWFLVLQLGAEALALREWDPHLPDRNLRFISLGLALPFAWAVLPPGANLGSLIQQFVSCSPSWRGRGHTGGETAALAWWHPPESHHKDKGVENLGGRSQSQKYQKFFSRVAEKAKERWRKLNPVDCIYIEGENSRALS